MTLSELGDDFLPNYCLIKMYSKVYPKNLNDFLIEYKILASRNPKNGFFECDLLLSLDDKRAGKLNRHDSQTASRGRRGVSAGDTSPRVSHHSRGMSRDTSIKNFKVLKLDFLIQKVILLRFQDCYATLTLKTNHWLVKVKPC